MMRNRKPEIESRYAVRKLGLFGSYVRDQQDRRSDIDILVSSSRDIDLFDFLDLREFLEARLNHKVDLVMESALKPAIGKRMLTEANMSDKGREIAGYLNDILTAIARRA